MSIYTKTGDTGKTALFGGTRVSKYNPQVEAYGVVDEATCFIGLAYESIQDAKDRKTLTSIQLNLYAIMAYLSNAPLKSTELIEEVNNMEKEMDRLESILPKLTRFILPQGSESAVRLHIARSKIRTAERRIVEFVDNKKTQITEDLLIMKYINRLSDFFFMLARKYSNEEKVT